MRHHNVIKKFGRVSRQRTALLRSLACALIVHGRIETTEAKAKSLRPFIERLVTKAKNDSLANKRLVIARLGGREREAMKLFADIAPKYKDRNGGYTRITKVFEQSSDGHAVAVIEFV